MRIEQSQLLSDDNKPFEGRTEPSSAYKQHRNQGQMYTMALQNLND
jgi:hypothetical protein